MSVEANINAKLREVEGFMNLQSYLNLLMLIYMQKMAKKVYAHSASYCLSSVNIETFIFLRNIRSKYQFGN